MSNYSVKTIHQSVFLLALAVTSSSAFSAGACTYQEAIMALEQGNSVRGMALMRMAYNDGDERAGRFLASKNIIVRSSPATSKPHADQLVGLTQAKPE